MSIKHSETCCEVKLTQMVDARVLGPRRGDTEVEGASIGKLPVDPSTVTTSLSASGVLSTCSGIIDHERIRCVSIDNSRKSDEAQCWRTGLLSLLNLHSAQKSFTQEPGFRFLLKIFF